MITKLLLVALGGGAGSVLRFLLQRSLNTNFPYGTVGVNLAGCFLIGLLWAALGKAEASENYRLLLVTGLCGGFTTFSAFTQESLDLLQQERFFSFLTYLAISVGGGLAATFLGYKLLSS